MTWVLEAVQAALTQIVSQLAMSWASVCKSQIYPRRPHLQLLSHHLHSINQHDLTTRDYYPKTLVLQDNTSRHQKHVAVSLPRLSTHGNSGLPNAEQRPSPAEFLRNLPIGRFIPDPWSQKRASAQGRADRHSKMSSYLAHPPVYFHQNFSATQHDSTHDINTTNFAYPISNNDCTYYDESSIISHARSCYKTRAGPA